ncbi:hypothetical protein M758_1G148700 [Ceratodon purpureus]|nr:hypothetical protein M758_1G148700 [Ceratodon purpureus]
MHRCKDDDGAGRMRHCNRPVMQKEPKSLSACLQIPKLTQSRLPSEKPLLVEERIRFSLPPGFAFVTVRRLKFSFRKGSCCNSLDSLVAGEEGFAFPEESKKRGTEKRQTGREGKSPIPSPLASFLMCSVSDTSFVASRARSVAIYFAEFVVFMLPHM